MFEGILLTFVLAVLSTVLILLYSTRNFKYWSSRGVLSIPNPYPIVGNMLEVLLGRKTGGEHLRDLYFWNEDAPYVGFYAGSKPALLLRSPDVIKEIFLKEYPKFKGKNVALNVENDPICANILFFMNYESWRYSRTKVTPLLSWVKVKNMLPLMIEAGDQFSEYIKRTVVPEGYVDAKTLCMKFTTDVTTSCIFGVRGRSFGEDPDTLGESGHAVFLTNFRTALKQNLHFMAPKIANFFKTTFFENEHVDKLASIFWEVFQERKRNGGFRNDLVDTLIKFERTEKEKIGRR